MYTEKSVDPRPKVLAAIQAVLAPELSTEVQKRQIQELIVNWGPNVQDAADLALLKYFPEAEHLLEVPESGTSSVASRFGKEPIKQ